MSDYAEAENILGEYTKQSENQIVELNKLIIALRTKVSMLEKELEDLDKIPIPRTVINQVIELEAKNRKLQEDINYYVKFVPQNVKEKREKQKAPTRKGGLR